LYLAGWWSPKPIFASSLRGIEKKFVKRVSLALGITDVESSADDSSQRLGCRPDLLIPGKYALWRTDAVNLSIRKVGHEEGGARRGHGSGDVVRSGDAIQ
jgi:hypothetical protein